MKFFPPESFTIETNMSVEDVSMVMRNFVQRDYESGVLSMKSFDNYFIGVVRHDSFKITRATSLKNYSGPVIEGAVVANPGGSHVEVVIDYSWGQKLFGIGLLAFSAFIGVVVMLFPGPDQESGSEYSMLVMFPILLTIFWLAFNIEEFLARRKLLRILKGKLFVETKKVVNDGRKGRYLR